MMAIQKGVSSEIVIGSYPQADGWLWLYRFYDKVIRPNRFVHRIVRGYLVPTWIEEWERGRVYRMLGVHRFGRWIPTGGAGIRRLTKQRMAAYTLAGVSITAAREFFYRACVFELLHLPFALTLLWLVVHRFSIGRADLAWENLIINLVVNVYPIMHHRYTRVRIARLLRRDAVRPGKGDHGGPPLRCTLSP